MRLRFWMIGFLLAAVPFSFAQRPPEGVPLPTTSGTGFTGAPYAGQETTVTVKPLADGSKSTQTFVTLIWRDTEGRTRREMIRHAASGVEFRSVIVTDPVAGVNLKWENGDESGRKVMSIWPVSAAQRVTAPSRPGPAAQERPGATGTIPDFRREVLRPQEINGIYAEGTRTTRVVRLDEESSNRSVEVTNELWTSPELRIIVRHVMDDPRTGTTTTNVTDVVRGESDPWLFKAPEGYEVVDHRKKSPRPE